MKIGDRILCNSNHTLILEVLREINYTFDVVCKQKGNSGWRKGDIDNMPIGYYDKYFTNIKGQEAE